MPREETQQRVARALSESSSSDDGEGDGSGDDAGAVEHQQVLERCQVAGRSTDFLLMKKVIVFAPLTTSSVLMTVFWIPNRLWVKRR
jgi:hypothetical protein